MLVATLKYPSVPASYTFDPFSDASEVGKCKFFAILWKVYTVIPVESPRFPQRLGNLENGHGK